MNKFEIAGAIYELKQKPQYEDKKLTELMHEILMEVKLIEAKAEELKTNSGGKPWRSESLKSSLVYVNVKVALSQLKLLWLHIMVESTLFMQ